MNPVLPRTHFVPDAEAREMPDGRLYVYGSYDLSGKQSYCSDTLHVFSTDDMIHWKHHGVCFRTADIPWIDQKCELYAPDCICRDGKYYLYFCTSNQGEGVAVADQPWGPFTDPTPVVGANGDGIDPAVFVDDDGQAYYYWGQFSLRAAKLNADMRTLDPNSITRCLIDEKCHGFHEGSSVRKRNGIYYLVFSDISRGRPTCLGYATSRHPLGPFEYKGIIVDNIGCDPQTWNNHGSINAYKGQWYVFYHRASQNGFFNRRLCIEPIAFEKDGSIREILPTTQGVEPPISVGNLISAADACRIGRGNSFIMPDQQIAGEEVLYSSEGNGWAAYRYVNFDRPICQVTLEMEAEQSGRIELWADDEPFAEAEIVSTAGQLEKRFIDARPVQGTHTLYLVWKMPPNSKVVFKTLSFA